MMDQCGRARSFRHLQACAASVEYTVLGVWRSAAPDQQCRDERRLLDELVLEVRIFLFRCSVYALLTDLTISQRIPEPFTAPGAA